MVLRGLDGLVISFSGADEEFLRAGYEFMMASKSFVFRFDDVEVREREFTLIKAGKVLAVEPKAFRDSPIPAAQPSKADLEGRTA